jgi:uncharacterized protein YjiS (DUF1127 family)
VSNRLLFSEVLRLQSRELLPARRWLPLRDMLSWDSFAAAWRRYRSRQRIAELDSHLLKDIGVGFAEAEAEANKPFWRA